jgi:hypothetical protein
MRASCGAESGVNYYYVNHSIQSIQSPETRYSLGPSHAVGGPARKLLQVLQETALAVAILMPSTTPLPALYTRQTAL